MMMPNPIRLTRIVRKMTARGLLISLRGASPRRTPLHAHSRGSRAPLRSRGPLVSLATSDDDALDHDRRLRHVLHAIPRRHRLDRRDLVHRIPTVEDASEDGVAV